MNPHDKLNEFSELQAHVESPSLRAAALKREIDYRGWGMTHDYGSRADSTLAYQDLQEHRMRMGDWP